VDAQEDTIIAVSVIHIPSKDGEYVYHDLLIVYKRNAEFLGQLRSNRAERLYCDKLTRVISLKKADRVVNTMKGSGVHVDTMKWDDWLKPQSKKEKGSDAIRPKRDSGSPESPKGTWDPSPGSGSAGSHPVSFEATR
jgi:hypothetical protein